MVQGFGALGVTVLFVSSWSINSVAGACSGASWLGQYVRFVVRYCLLGQGSGDGCALALAPSYCYAVVHKERGWGDGCAATFAPSSCYAVVQNGERLGRWLCYSFFAELSRITSSPVG